MSVAINLLTTLEYLGPYSNGVSQDVYCGVVLSVAADPGTTVDATVIPFLQPWIWSVSAVSIWEMNPDGSNPTQLSNLQIVPPAGFTLDAGILTQVQNDFGTNKGIDFCWTDPQTVDPAKPGGAPASTPAARAIRGQLTWRSWRVIPTQFRTCSTLPLS